MKLWHAFLQRACVIPSWVTAGAELDEVNELAKRNKYSLHHLHYTSCSLCKDGMGIHMVVICCVLVSHITSQLFHAFGFTRDRREPTILHAG